MRWFLKRLYRERRRLVVVAAVTFLGGFIAFFRNPNTFWGLPFPVVAGLAFMVVLTTFIMLLVVLFPKIRHTAESVSISVPCLSLMGAFSSTEDGGMSNLTGVIGIVLAYLFATLYGTSFLDRYLPRRAKKLSSMAQSDAPPEALWPYLTVNPDSFERFGDDETLSMTWIEPGVRYRDIGRCGDLGKVEEVHVIDVSEPCKRYRFSFEAVDATENAAASRGSKEYRLTAHDGGTRLQTIREFDRVTLRGQLMIWIDDGFGRLDDAFLLKAEAELRG